MDAGTPTVTQQDIAAGLRAVGLAAGHHVVVHSSLSRLGRVDSGPNAVIDALQDVVTSEGTLVAPTFSSQALVFIEKLALERGINGTGSGSGVVFDGTLGLLFASLKPLAEALEPGWIFPFGSSAALWSRLHGEGHAPGSVWSIAAPVNPVDGDRIVLERHGSPRAAEDVVPWRMPVWTGAISIALERRPDALRSHQYSGSFTVWGGLGESFVEGHDNQPGQPLHTHPLHRAKEAGGKILLIGVDHSSNSTIHIAQQAALAARGLALAQGGTEFVGHFQTVDKPLDSTSGQRRAVIGNADIRLVETAVMYDVVDRLLDERIAEGLEVVEV